MTDMVINGTGNSRFLKSVANFMTLYPTYEDFAQALIAGTLPIDLNGINPTGVQTTGTKLNKASLLKDDTAALYGLGADAVPDDVLKLALFPPGSILFFGANVPPDGFLICDGSQIKSSDYPALYNAIGTTFGGNSTNFKLPDLRNNFLRGISSGLSPTTELGKKYAATSIPYLTQGNLGISSSSATNADSNLEAQSSGNLKVSSNAHYATTYYYAATVRPQNVGLLPIIKY